MAPKGMCVGPKGWLTGELQKGERISFKGVS